MRWGICSAGKISHDFLNAMTIVADNNKAVAIAARSVQRAQEMADLFDIPRAYGSYEELAVDPEVDIVYVGTIHPEHHKAALLFLKNGKHVLCEKPMTMNLKEAEELVSVAREKKRFLMEGYWSRFFPIYNRLRELVDSGAVGNVQLVEASFEVPIAHIPRIKEKALGGGSILDLGCYCIQFAQWIYRESHEQLQISCEYFETGVDKSARIVLLYPGGKRAILTCHGDLDGKTGAAIIGDKGRIELPRFFWSSTEMVLPDGRTEQHPLPSGAKREFNFVNSQGFTYEIEHTRQCIEKALTESPLMSLEETLHMTALRDTCLEKLGIKFD